MGSAITLFSGYDRSEDRTTNYTLLIFKMLYEENPKFLSEILRELIDERFAEEVGVKFRQQQRGEHGVPDGLIRQSAFTIFIETKRFDWFYDAQLERHLEDLDKSGSGVKILIALGRFDEEMENRFRNIESICAEKYHNYIVFAAISFEDLISALGARGVSKNLSDTIRDFRAYLDEESLLPTWQEWLDVVNCASTADEVWKQHAYLCPAASGAYNHDRCRFFGIYRNKQVEGVGEIRAVVDVESPTQSKLRWKNSKETNEDLEQEARSVVHRLRPSEYPTRAFLLGELIKTSFKKGSKGGMFNAKKYFRIAPAKAQSTSDLADFLNGKNWADFKQ